MVYRESKQVFEVWQEFSQTCQMTRMFPHIIKLMGFLSPHFLLISNCAEMTRFFLQFSERDGLLLQNVGEDKNIAIYPMISSPKCITATFFYKLIKVDNIRYCILSFLTIHETEGTSFWYPYNVRLGWIFYLIKMKTWKVTFGNSSYNKYTEAHLSIVNQFFTAQLFLDLWHVTF